MSYKHTVLGGTFDRLHKGHTTYLKAAFKNSERVTIGLTTDKLNKGKEFWQIIQTYSLRKKELLKTIKANWPHVRVVIVPIDDIFGPSIKDPTIDAIVVTDITLENGKKVNEERIKRGLGELKIVLVPIIDAQDSRVLSSSRVRRGEIDRKGQVYNRQFSKTHNLPEYLRLELRKPLGLVIKGGENDKDKVAIKVRKLLEREKYTLSIAVGDVVSSTLEDAGFKPDVKIIDFKTQRKFLPTFDSNEKFDTKNTAGTISSTSSKYLEREIEKVIKQKTKKTITIDGEEDLLVLPVILMSPLESIVFYGQRDVGMIVVRVTENVKKEVASLISQFT